MKALIIVLAFVGSLTVRLGTVFWIGWFIWSLVQGGSFLSTFFVCAGWWLLTVVIGCVLQGISSGLLETIKKQQKGLL